MRYLYNNDELATALEEHSSISIIRSNNHALSIYKKSGNEHTELLARDVKGTTLSLLIVARKTPIAFSPWGYCPSAGGMLAGFKGEHCDPITICYLLGNGYRSFSPLLMRFTSPDSVSPFGAGGVNSYAYLSGDPVNASDPTGHVRGKVLLRENNLGVFTSKKRFWQKKVLNIYAHGENSMVAGMDVNTLYDHLSAKQINFDRYRKIHIIACHSGEAGLSEHLSFAEHFSNKTQKPVKAYIGTVSTVPKPQQDNRYTKVKILRKNIYQTQNFNYTPITFQPITEQGINIRNKS
ncbi:RHS repeat-associated core domain-containing protein [Pseudomonas sp. NPDC089392]|uniref:RHS repeat-associated core domain-containing protein n=1 Tax=Pseudomonas sp. NPDC089392 TaxID=3364459 RepID=UPI00381E7D4A